MVESDKALAGGEMIDPALAELYQEYGTNVIERPVGIPLQQRSPENTRTILGGAAIATDTPRA